LTFRFSVASYVLVIPKRLARSSRFDGGIRERDFFIPLLSGIQKSGGQDNEANE